MVVRLLADENIHLLIVNALRAAGHDVAWMRLDAPGTDDVDILPLANQQESTLLTYDTDFGQLIFARGMLSERGVILVRMTGSIESHALRLLEVLDEYDDWSNYFTTITGERVRRRRLPRQS
ncbi:MAG: DUF5615 family PIN-like protein [Chloroflexi bacterium]|nr:DUF5615 family PIN-like protein [Chloroflexota bacterium]MCY3589628.1 DUF5615 family PIN-like protein [Chloroflexota bacterium]MCY3687171.1 DUF5615 family PIN-like protein [Chloroflexota bacterium]MDE2707351.1 DUF5615 family PIN-like protein [Chloroflexota bacterium]